MTTAPILSLEERVEAVLRTPDADAATLRQTLQALYDQYSTHKQALERLIHISDKYHSAERDRSLSYADELQRKVRQVEKIVRISDGYHAMLQDLNARLTDISAHDALTGLPNRRYAQDRLKQSIAKFERDGTAFSVALVDVDHFKRINDNGGHDAGDKALTRIAQCLLGCVREYDVCARWGGEEFLLLFMSCDLGRAAVLAERVRGAIAALDVAELVPGGQMTVSIGFAECRDGDSIDTVLKNADTALYRAKNDGRNRIVAAP